MDDKGKITLEDILKMKERLNKPQDSGIDYFHECGNKIRMFWGQWGELKRECYKCKEKINFDPYSEEWLLNEMKLPVDELRRRKEKIEKGMVRLGNGLYVHSTVAHQWYQFCIDKKEFMANGEKR